MTTLQPAPSRRVPGVPGRLDQHPVDRPAVRPSRPVLPAPDRSELDRTAPDRVVVARRSLRDPFVDGVRAVGTLLVIALHWVMVEATWDGDRLLVGNALAHGSAWLLTWLQPLPLLFFAAGAAARYDLVRHPDQPGWRFAGSRLLRMAVPVGVFAAVWVALVAVLPPLGVPEAAVDRAARIVPQPLWFLAVQLGLLALTPWLVRLVARHGSRVLVVAAAAPLVVDLLRFSDEVTFPGAPNILLVWAVPYLGGVVHAGRRAAALAGEHEVPDGSEQRGGRPAARSERGVLALVAAGGLTATVLLLTFGPYPVSLIGLPGDAMSNLAPPTAPVVTFAIAQVAAALLVRDALAGWAGRSRMVRWVGARSMGLYLWHLTAMFAVSGTVLLALGRALPEPWTWDWWTTRAGYLGASALVLVVLVALAARAQRLVPRRRAAGAGPADGGRERAGALPVHAHAHAASTAPVGPAALAASVDQPSCSS